MSPPQLLLHTDVTSTKISGHFLTTNPSLLQEI